VGHEQVIPLVGLQLRLAGHLEGVLRPLVDDVRAEAVALDPQVPAAVIVLVVQAGDHGAGRAAPRDAHPGAVREGLSFSKSPASGTSITPPGWLLNPLAATCPTSQPTPALSVFTHRSPSRVK